MTFLNHGNFHCCKEICHLNNTSHKFKSNITQYTYLPCVPSPSHQASLPLAFTYSRRSRGNDWIPSPKYMIVCELEVLLMSLRSKCEFVYLFMLMIWKDCDMRMAEGMSMIIKTQDNKKLIMIRMTRDEQ